jgi:hypothetical protein
MSATLEAPVAPPRPSGAKQVYRFRILSGTHWANMPAVDEDGQPVLDPDGKPVMKAVPFGPGRPNGDIVQTTQRLDRLLNRGSKVVQMLDENDDEKVTQIAELQAENRGLVDRLKKQVYAMDVRQLIEYCEAEEWDHENSSDKSRLIAIVLRNLGISNG